MRLQREGVGETIEKAGLDVRALSSQLVAMVALGATFLIGSGASAQVSGRISRVGLSGGGAQLVREGNWTFVEVMLASNGAAPFAGVLEVQQPDRDGDIARCRTPVALAPGAEPRPYAVYFVQAPRGSGQPISVRLLDERGQVVPTEDEHGEVHDSLTSDPITSLSSESGLLLDLSEPPIGLLAYRPPPKDPSLQRQAPSFDRWELRPLDPRSLPDRWIGLELADVVVWDDPDVGAVSPAQLRALVEWVRYGGRLILSASRNWQTINQSALAEILPVVIQDVRPAKEIQEFTQKIMGDETHDLDAYFDEHPAARCVMSPVAGAVSVPASSKGLEGLDPLVYRRSVGRGTVTFVGASLRELLGSVALPKADPRSKGVISEDIQREVARRAETARNRVYERILGIARETPQGDALNSAPLFEPVRATIGFQTAGLAYMLAAVGFAVAYTLTAAFGSWWWLRKRRLLHHAWTAFTVMAIAGTAVGSVAVVTLRGVTTRLEQTSMVDGGANSNALVGSALFGVKTPSHMRLDVRLPLGGGDADADSDGLGPIRSLPSESGGLLVSEEFVAPQSYTVTNSSELIEKLPIRATVKELDGYWDGTQEGRLEAALVMAPVRLSGRTESVDRFVRGTAIRNRLGVDLHDCYLLVNPDDYGVLGPAGINCFFLGDIRSSGSGSELDENSAAIRANFFDRADPRDPNSKETERTRGQLPLLRQATRQWANGLRSIFGTDQLNSLAGGEGRDANAERALLLLSTLSAYDPEAKDGTGLSSATLLRTHGRRLDCLHQLNRNQAILIGFASKAPSMTLNVDGRGLFAGRGLTMYRFTIPIERRAQAE